MDRSYQTEQMLIQDLKKSSRKAFNEIYAMYAKRLYAYCLQYSKSVEDAEDIVQDVFIRLWEKKAEYDKIPDFRTFLYVAVRNLCYNYLRDKKKTIDFSQIELPDKQLSFQEQLIQEETYRLISNAIAELPVQSGKIMQISAGDRSSAPSQN